MTKAVLFLLLCLASFSASAQFNDTSRYQVLVSSTGAINKTDKDKAYLLNNVFNFRLKVDSVTFNANNTWIYGKQNGMLTNIDFSSTLYADWRQKLKDLYYWGLFNYNTSYSLKVNNQVLAGAGVAYNVIDKKNARLNFSDGILYDQSNLLTNLVYHTYRNSFRLQFRVNIKDRLTLTGINFLQTSLSDRHDYIIRSTTTLGLKLFKTITLATALSYNKMNITHSDNFNFTYGLVFDQCFN